MKKLDYKKTSSFISVVLITIVITRIWAISLFYIFGKDSLAIETIVNDSWHHYHVGLVLIVLAFLLSKLKRTRLLLAIGLGIFLEEWPVFLNDLGFGTNALYQTKIDFIAIILIVGFFYVLARILSKKYQVV